MAKNGITSVAGSIVGHLVDSDHTVHKTDAFSVAYNVPIMLPIHKRVLATTEVNATHLQIPTRLLT